MTTPSSAAALLSAHPLHDLQKNGINSGHFDTVVEACGANG
jgi:hypothetical protein